MTCDLGLLFSASASSFQTVFSKSEIPEMGHKSLISCYSLRYFVTNGLQTFSVVLHCSLLLAYFSQIPFIL